MTPRRRRHVPHISSFHWRQLLSLIDGTSRRLLFFFFFFFLLFFLLHPHNGGYAVEMCRRNELPQTGGLLTFLAVSLDTGVTPGTGRLLVPRCNSSLPFRNELNRRPYVAHSLASSCPLWWHIVAVSERARSPTPAHSLACSFALWWHRRYFPHKSEACVVGRCDKPIQQFHFRPPYHYCRLL